MAYDIVHTLKKSGKDAILKTLQQGVEAKEKLKGTKHQVFRLSFSIPIRVTGLRDSDLAD